MDEGEQEGKGGNYLPRYGCTLYLGTLVHVPRSHPSPSSSPPSIHPTTILCSV